MNIVVCIKQVPDTEEVRINPKTNNLDREGVRSIMNPYDKNALEEGIRLKEQHGGTITVMSMGPPQAEDVLREALAMGADEAILLSDRAFAGADTFSTTYVLAEAIKNLNGGFDLILCGKHAVDADTGQVGPGLAERLGIAQITFVEGVEIEGKVRAKRKVEEGFEIVESGMPVLLTVTEKINQPRYPKPVDIMKAARKKLTIWNAETLGIAQENAGQAGSPTVVGRLFTPQPKGKAEMFEGEPEEVCERLLAKLKSEKVI